MLSKIGLFLEGPVRGYWVRISKETTRPSVQDSSGRTFGDQSLNHRPVCVCFPSEVIVRGPVCLPQTGPPEPNSPRDRPVQATIRKPFLEFFGSPILTQTHTNTLFLFFSLLLSLSFLFLSLETLSWLDIGGKSLRKAWRKKRKGFGARRNLFS